MNIKKIIENKISEIIENIYQISSVKLEVQQNKSDFENWIYRCQMVITQKGVIYKNKSLL